MLPIVNLENTVSLDLTSFREDGFYVIEEAITAHDLPAVQAAYERNVEAAMANGHAKKNPETGFLDGYRYQNPHHPLLAEPCLLAAMCSPRIDAFTEALLSKDRMFYGAAAFAMRPDFVYHGGWHRDYGREHCRDHEAEHELFAVPTIGNVQVMLPLLDDASFWIVPGSHRRVNTPEEARMFAEGCTGHEYTFPGAQQIDVPAGTAVAFDPRAIHRGLKEAGPARRSLFIVYGRTDPDSRKLSNLFQWADDEAYRDADYLAQCPPIFRARMLRTLELYGEASPS